MVNLLRHMDRTRFEMMLGVLNTKTSVYLDDVPNDVEFIDIGSPRVRYAITKIIKLIRSKQPNVVFSTLGHLNLMMGMLRPFLPKNIHFIGRADTILSIYLSHYKHPKLWGLAYRCFYGRFDKIICQSKYMRDDLIENFNQSPKKLIVINNPVDVDLVRQMASEPIPKEYSEMEFLDPQNKEIIKLISVGRLVHTKGFDLLMEALSICQNPKFHLTILGQGPDEDSLKALAANLGIAKQISFLGFQKNPYAFIARSDAYILSSRYEGFPNVVLESLACCTPVIATPAPGGTREILGNLEGCLIADSVSAEGLAKALTSFKFSKKLDQKLIEPYEVKRIVEMYQNQFLMPILINQSSPQ